MAKNKQKEKEKKPKPVTPSTKAAQQKMWAKMLKPFTE